MNQTIFVLELIGTIAFAISGISVAIENELDLLGITLLGITTAVGGGIIRDITLGITPPTAFVRPFFTYVSLMTVAASLLFIYTAQIQKLLKIKALKQILFISDSVGLAAFTIIGANVAINHGFAQQLLLILFVGMITGVGGGVLRDLFTLKTPALFTKHVYGLASLVGAFTYFYLRLMITPELAVYLSATLIVLIRFITAHFNIELPKIKRFH